MSGSDCGHGARRAALGGRGPRDAEQIAALRALVAGCPDCKLWWRQECEVSTLASHLAARAPAPRPAPRAAWLLVPAAAALAAGLLWIWPQPVEQLTLAGGAAVASVVIVAEPGGGMVQHPVREQDAEVQLGATSEAWISLSTRAVRLPDATVTDATLLVWAAGDGRIDLINRERLARGPDGVATFTPLMAPQQVSVGDGLEIVVAVFEGEVAALPASVTPRAPTAGLPAQSVSHNITIEARP